MAQSDRTRARARVSGRVQGVCFRISTVEAARELALNGWVRNLGDGRVEWEAEGPREAVEQLVSWSWKGPTFARVESVEVEWVGVDDEIEHGREERGFRVRG